MSINCQMLINFGKYVTLLSSAKTFSIMPSSRVGHDLISTIRPTSVPCSSFVLSHQPLASLEARGLRTLCNAIRRRVRYDDDDDDDEEYGRNEEIAMLELYSQSARGEVLLVKALVDGQEVEVLIFKGFSSCLSYETSADPSKSILPARAVIKSIDIIKGPFDPSNIDYLKRGLTWEEFKSNFLPN